VHSVNVFGQQQQQYETAEQLLNQEQPRLLLIVHWLLQRALSSTTHAAASAQKVHWTSGYSISMCNSQPAVSEPLLEHLTLLPGNSTPQQHHVQLTLACSRWS